jgi:hypothetical protein
MKLLMLLIGGNPIANYALIKFFKDYNGDKLFKFDKVMLIFTKQTEQNAKNIKELISDVDYIDVDVDNNERNLNLIKEEIKKKLEFNKIEKIHLNYTGATKSMSIGAYLAVEEYEFKEKFFSDIHPATYKIYLKRGEIFPENNSLADSIKMNIDEFCLLHGAILENKKEENSVFFSDTFVDFLLEKVEQVEHNNNFLNFWKQDFKNLKSSGEWKEKLKNYPIKFDSNLSNKQLEKLQKFIKGIFLEEYIFNFLKERQEIFNFDDIAWNVEIKNKRAKRFELDVVVTKGYTVYVISCTIDKKAYIKQKAFEANVRAEQIGGIGAKPILISCAETETVNKTKDEMINYVGKNSFEIAGIQELKDKKKLHEFFKKIF